MTDISEQVAGYASRFALPTQLVLAIIAVESSGSPFAWKVEPPYRYLVDVATRKPFRALSAAEGASEIAPADFPCIRGLTSRDTEWWGQQASWGPMQIMGAVAREYGFRRHFPELCGPVGVEFGCMHLARLKERFAVAKTGTVVDLMPVAAAYNAGSPRRLNDGRFANQEYVDRVQAAGGFR